MPLKENEITISDGVDPFLKSFFHYEKESPAIVEAGKLLGLFA